MNRTPVTLAFRTVTFLLILQLSAVIGFTATSTARRKHRKRPATAAATRTVVRPASLVRPAAYQKTRTGTVRTKSSAVAGPVIAGGPWTSPTYADSTQGDTLEGEDLEIRKAAVEALGDFNGSVVVTDAGTGRVLTMVNQKVALSEGFQPCSTVKVSVALAGLSEKVIQPQTKYRLGGMKMDLTYALAHSNNYYFATLGQKLGFEKVAYYSHLFGYGEKAGLNIAGEQAGRYPAAPPKNGGVGMLTSFGEEISQTPLQLAALIGAVANGGTLYYLQYPRTQTELQSFMPKVKRRLDIGEAIPAVKPGMRGAVEFGTAHRAREDGPIAGKTGTCTENHTHLGWFGSFNDIGARKLVVVVLLTGGRPAIGPQAAGIAGDIYRRLGERNVLQATTPQMTPAVLANTALR